MEIKYRLSISLKIIIVFLLLNLLTILVLLISDFSYESFAIVILCNTWYFILAFMLYYDISINGFDLFSPFQFSILFEFSMLIYLRPILIALNGWDSYWIDGKNNLFGSLIFGIICYILGHFSLFCGYILTKQNMFNWLIIKPKQLLTKGQVYWAVIFLLIISVAAWVHFVQSAGGLSFILANLRNRRMISEGMGYITIIAELITYVPLILLVYKSKFKIPTYFIFISTLVASASLVVFGGRASVLRVIMYLVIGYHYSIKEIKLKQVLPVLLISITVLIFLGEIRTQLIDGINLEGVVSEFFNKQETNNIKIVLENAYDISTETGSTFDRLIVLLQGVPNVIDFQYFTTYKSLILSIIPRSLWAEKPPISESGVYATLFGDYSNTGKYPAGIIGDYYLQLGLIGVIAGMFITGVLLKSFKLYRMKNTNNPSSLIIYILGITILYQGIRNLQLMNYLTAVIPLLIVFYLAKVAIKTK